jgi:hypothetical protein
MKKGLPQSIRIVLGQEDDGRWWADIESMPGVMAYGPTREAAVSAVRSFCVLWPTASNTVRLFRRSSKRSSPSHEPLAVRVRRRGFWRP